MSSILLEEFNTKYLSAPFSQINNEDYLPAIEKLISLHKKEIEDIVNNPAEPDFINTIQTLEASGRQLDIVSSIFFNLNSAETDEVMEALAMKIGPMLSEHSTWVGMHPELFQRVKFVKDHQSEDPALSAEDRRLLDETYTGFVRSGALLSEEDKKRLDEINSQLSQKTLQFGQNVLAATNAYEKYITDENLLSGLPEDIKAMYAAEADARGKKGFIITLQYPSYLPALTYLENRDLRKELFLAQGGKNIKDNEWNNEPLIREILSLRDEKAQLLGYQNFAAYVLEERMAGSPERVTDFLEDLARKAQPFAQKEIEEIKALGAELGMDQVESYDHAFLAEMLKKRKFDINDEELKPYFALQNVEKAVFQLAGKLFGLEFIVNDEVDVYHPDVTAYTVMKDGAYKALLYTDYFPRKGKRPGAWMTSYRPQYREHTENFRPHISVVCNFTPPGEDVPSLLTFNEVTTLFHEFGHALHGILADTHYASLSGTSVRWDFVELPSQFMENFCYEPDFLKTFATHYQTGEALPEEKIEKLNASKNFMEGYQTLRQISFGMLDMNYHLRPQEVTSVQDFEQKHTAAYRLYPMVEGVNQSTSFSHIFQGGYASGYYSYKWAEVLDADAFAFFKEKGLFNTEVAQAFQILLSKGGSEDPMSLYTAFRGGEPDAEHLIKRAFG